MRRRCSIKLESGNARRKIELNREYEVRDYELELDTTLRMPPWRDSLLFLFAVIFGQLNELLILLALAGRHDALRM